jgi:hypothetical protein
MPWPASPLEGKTTDWRAGCGRSARPVRREGEFKPMGSPYPYHVLLRGQDTDGRDKPGHDPRVDQFQRNALQTARYRAMQRSHSQRNAP